MASLDGRTASILTLDLQSSFAVPSMPLISNSPITFDSSTFTPSRVGERFLLRGKRLGMQGGRFNTALCSLIVPRTYVFCLLISFVTSSPTHRTELTSTTLTLTETCTQTFNFWAPIRTTSVDSLNSTPDGRPSLSKLRR